MKSLRLLAGLSLCCCLGCERELLPLDPSLIITGYEIRGTVRDRFGNPIPGVDVSVEYTYEWVDDGPEPQRVYQVASSGESMTVSVRSREGRVVLVVDYGSLAGVSFRYDWNGRDSHGQFVIPGVYDVRYISGSETRLTYPVVVSGTRVATTDSVGSFTVRDAQLPIGFYPVPEYSSSGTTYFGNLRVTSEVVLGFFIEGFSDYRNVTLRRNEALVFDTRLE